MEKRDEIEKIMVAVTCCTTLAIPHLPDQVELKLQRRLCLPTYTTKAMKVFKDSLKYFAPGRL